MAQNTLAAAIAGVYNSKDYSDATIRCGDREWHVHKVIICRQSEYFTKVFEGNFKEADTGALILEQDDPAVVEALLTFLYKSDYENACKTTGYESKFLFNGLVFAVAEKFLLPSLQQKAAAKFTKTASASFSQDSLAEAIAERSQNTLDPNNILGNAIRDIIVKHRPHIYNVQKASEGSQNPSKLQETISQIPWLAGEIAQNFATHGFDLKQLISKLYRCNQCTAAIFITGPDVAAENAKQCNCPNPRCNTRLGWSFDAWLNREIPFSLLEKET